MTLTFAAPPAQLHRPGAPAAAPVHEPAPIPAARGELPFADLPQRPSAREEIAELGRALRDVAQDPERVKAIVEQMLALARSEGRKRPILEGIDFSGLKLENINFSGVDLRECRFNRATVIGCNFDCAIMAHADLRDMSMRDSTLRRALLYGADLSGSTLAGCSFNRACLWRANFSDSVLERCDFNGAKLLRASFKDASFSDLTFNNTRLTADNEISLANSWRAWRGGAEVSLGLWLKHAVQLWRTVRDWLPHK